MKLLIKSVLILLFFVPLLTYAEQIDKIILPQFSDFEAMYINEGIVSGRHWKTFGEKDKGAYLLGYQDGVINTAIYYVPDEKEKIEVIDSFPSMDMDDLVKRIDEFYSDDRNLNIPIPYVLLIIRNRLIGTDEKDIEKYIEHLRESSGKERGKR